MTEKTVKLIKLKIEKFAWLSSSLFWIIAGIIAIDKQRAFIAIVLFLIGIASWKGQNKKIWDRLSEAEEFVRNNWK